MQYVESLVHLSQVSFQQISIFLLTLFFVTIVFGNDSLTTACDPSNSRKICLHITSSENGKTWLWLTPACKEPCHFQRKDITDGFHFVEELPTKEFGIELVPAGQDTLYLSGCSLDKNKPVMPAIISFPVTKCQYLNLNSNEATQSLLTDLARIQPNPQELLRRQQQIQAEPEWGRFMFSLLLAAVTPILVYCCPQC